LQLVYMGDSTAYLVAHQSGGTRKPTQRGSKFRFAVVEEAWRLEKWAAVGSIKAS
jgi:hypothetical protein